MHVPATVNVGVTLMSVRMVMPRFMPCIVVGVLIHPSYPLFRQPLLACIRC